MSGLRFLTAAASDAELLDATAEVHLDWLRRLAEASGGTVRYEHGVHWTSVSRSRSEINAAIVDPPPAEARELIDRMLRRCREERIDRFGFWAFSDTSRLPPAAWLGARGFRSGGRPHWMYRDLDADPDLPSLAELSERTGMTLAERFTPVEGTPMPCFDPDTAWVREAMTRRRPQRVWHGVVHDGERPVVQLSLNASVGALGVCALHDGVVLDSHRTSGIGAGYQQWGCRYARDLGARYVVLNAAHGNGPVFRAWGFRSLGFGRTWWLGGDPLHREFPTDEIAFAEAVGLDDVDTLEALGPTRGPDVTLPNGLTPLRFAAELGARRSAAWLREHDAGPDLLSAWDLGGADAAAQELDAAPELLNERGPHSGRTLLHAAVDRDDPALVRFLLDAGIDPDVRDARFGATPTEWARRLRRIELTGLLVRRLGGSGQPRRGG